MTSPQLWDAWAAAWTVLGRLFQTAPNQETLDAIRSPEMLADWPLPDGERSAEGLALLAESAATGETAEQVHDDHFLLVVGPGKVKAVPWESVYLSSEGLVFEAQTLEVRQFYRRFGLQAPKLNREPDDHISLELEFCATLLNRAMTALEAGEDAQAVELADAHTDFCRQHLFAWAPEFFRRVEEGADTAFYRGIGILGQDALAQVAAALDAEEATD